MTVQATVQEEIYGGTIQGPVPGPSLPTGDIQFATGLEYRREESDVQPDSLQQAGLTAGNAFPGKMGSFNVFEYFAEVEVPLFKDVDFVKEFNLGGAMRFSNYSLQGNKYPRLFR